MNRKIKVLIVICLLFVMTFGNIAFLGELAGEVIAAQLKGKSVEIQSEVEVEKYIQYQTGDDKGTLLQIKLTTSLVGKEKEMISYGEQVEFEKINLNGIEAKEIIVLNSYGNKVDYETLENGNICFLDNGEEATQVFKIIFLYGEESYQEYQNEYSIQIKGNVTQNVTQDVETVILENDFDTTKIIKDKIGDIVGFSIIDNVEQNVYKGYLYANAISENRYETDYHVKTDIEISAKDLVTQVALTENVDRFIMNTGNALFGSTNIVFKNTWIEKSNLIDILGQEGYIAIYDIQNNEIARLTAGESDIILVNYDMLPNSIQIKTSNPIKEGTLEIHHTKAIVSSAGFSVEQIQTFTAIERSIDAKAYRTVQKEIEIPVEL